MKKIRFLFTLLIPLFMLNCSNDDPEPVRISLKEDELTVGAGSSKFTVVSGLYQLSREDYKIYSLDEYVTTADYIKGSQLVVQGIHEGTTKIIIETAHDRLELTVIVISSPNYIGKPIIEFGKSQKEILQKTGGYGGAIVTPGKLRIRENDDAPIYSNYYFKEDKLECIVTESSFSKNFKEDITWKLTGRYNFLYEENDKRWYTYRDREFFISEHIRKPDYGIFIIKYAKDKKTMDLYTEYD